MKAVLTVVLFLMMSMSFTRVSVAEDVKPKGVLRAGLGIPYGLLGLNYEHPLRENNIALSGGLGYVENGIRWAAGTKIFFGNSYRSRLYFCGYHGVVDLKRTIGTTRWTVKTGTAIGVGIGKRSWHLDVIYILNEHKFAPAFGWAIK